MQGSAPYYYDIPFLGAKGGWRALSTNNHFNIMATQNLLSDRKRTRTSLDIMTSTSDSPQICSWPRFLLEKGTDDERSLCRLSPVNLCRL